mmetsp:Transcript_111367/g.359443  ORF Transcript_111367/g.359443 Transcript_111367/m.359443 type:complete len:230 (+) Transcript_111367:746-1435(+)
MSPTAGAACQPCPAVMSATFSRPPAGGTRCLSAATAWPWRWAATMWRRRAPRRNPSTPTSCPLHLQGFATPQASTSRPLCRRCPGSWRRGWLSLARTEPVAPECGSLSAAVLSIVCISRGQIRLPDARTSACDHWTGRRRSTTWRPSKPARSSCWRIERRVGPRRWGRRALASTRRGTANSIARAGRATAATHAHWNQPSRRQLAANPSTSHARARTTNALAHRFVLVA